MQPTVIFYANIDHCMTLWRLCPHPSYIRAFHQSGTNDETHVRKSHNDLMQFITVLVNLLPMLIGEDLRQ